MSFPVISCTYNVFYTVLYIGGGDFVKPSFPLILAPDALENCTHIEIIKDNTFEEEEDFGIVLTSTAPNVVPGIKSFGRVVIDDFGTLSYQKKYLTHQYIFDYKCIFVHECI